MFEVELTPYRRSNISFHNPIRRDFEKGIRQREQRHRNRVIRVGHASPLKETVASFLVQNLAVANVASIQVIEEIDPGAER